MPENHQPNFQKAFIGRTDILKDLHNIKDQVLRQRRGRLVLLSHEGGIGKTTLVRQFLSEVASQPDPPAVFTVDCVHIAQSREPFKPFSGLLEQVAKARSQPYQRWLHRLSPKLFEGLPWVGPVLGETVQMFIDKEKAEASTRSINADSAILEYIQLFQEMTQIKPMILFIDDLHWMDASSANLLYAIARQIEKMPLMLVGNYRSDEIEATAQEPERPFRAILLEIRRYKLAKIFALRLFSEDEVKQYLDAAFNPNDFPPELIHRLAHQTGGLPYFFSELAIYLYESGAIAERNGVWHATDRAQDIQSPASIDALIQIRMGTLEASQQKLLRYACVLGEQFRTTVLVELLRQDRLEILDMLQEISEKRLLVYEIDQPERQEYEPDWRFNHSLTQQCLYNHLAETQKVEIHQRAAKIIESAFPSLPDPLAWELARHHHGAHQWEEAARFGLQATCSSYKAQSYIDVVETASEALADLAHLPNPDPTCKSDLYWLLSRSQAYLQQFDAAEQNGRLCLELAQQTGDVPRQIGALTRLVEVYLREHQSEDLRQVYTQAWELACGQDSPVLMAYVAQFWARDISILLPELSRSYAQQTIEIARQRSHKPALVLGLYSLGHILYCIHQLDGSLAAFEEAIHWMDEMSEGESDRYDVNEYVVDEIPIVPNIRYHSIREDCLEFGARIHQELGQWQQAIQELWQVYESKVRFGDKPGEAGLQSVISEAYLKAGELDQALALHEDALRLAEALESQRLLAQILRVGLQVATQRMDTDLLANKLEAFQSISGTNESYPYRALILEMNGHLSFLRGQVGKAAHTFRQLLVISEQHRDRISQANAHCGLATCGLQVGALEQAYSHAKAALDIQTTADPHCLGDTFLLLSRIANAQGASEEAAEHREQARQFFLERAYTARVQEVDALAASDQEN